MQYVGSLEPANSVQQSMQNPAEKKTGRSAQIRKNPNPGNFYRWYSHYDLMHTQSLT